MLRDRPSATTHPRAPDAEGLYDRARLAPCVPEEDFARRVELASMRTIHQSSHRLRRVPVIGNDGFESRRHLLRDNGLVTGFAIARADEGVVDLAARPAT